MNIRQRQGIAQEFNRLLASIEKVYVVRIYNALKAQMSAVVLSLKQGGIEYARRRVQSDGIGMVMTETIRRMHREVGLVMARRTLSSLRKSPTRLKRGFGNNAEWVREIQEYFRLHLLESVSTISETTKNHILKILSQATEEGWTLDRTIKEINDKVYLGHRAERIVRTESVRAANYGVNLGADTYDYEVEKEWCAFNDDRTRDSHRHGSGVDGEVRDIGLLFSNGLEFPGDPKGSAKEIINCRCSMAIIAKRDKNGRLIPKRRTGLVIPVSSGRPITV